MTALLFGLMLFACALFAAGTGAALYLSHWLDRLPLIGGLTLLIGATVACGLLCVLGRRRTPRDALSWLPIPPGVVALACVGLLLQAALTMEGVSRPAETVTQLSTDREWILFVGQNKLLAYDVRARRLQRLRTSVAAEPDALLSDPRRPAIFLRRLVSPAGKTYPLEFGDHKWASRLRLSPPVKAGRLLSYQIYRHGKQTENNGVWMRDLVNGKRRWRLREAGWDLRWSADGRQRYLCLGSELLRVGEEGQDTVLFRHPDDQAKLYQPDLSPDGKRLVFRAWTSTGSRRGTESIHAVDVDGSNPKALYEARPGSALRSPRWSPDGSRIAFRHRGVGRERGLRVYSLMVMRADGGDARRLIEPSGGFLSTPRGVASFAWSPDGERLALMAAFLGGTVLTDEGGGTRSRFDLYLVDVASGELERITRLSQPRKRSGYGFPLLWYRGK